MTAELLTGLQLPLLELHGYRHDTLAVSQLHYCGHHQRWGAISAQRVVGTTGRSAIDHQFRPENGLFFSRSARPYEGLPCVFVNARIRETEPLVYAFLESFAKDNALKLVPWEP